MYFRKNFIVINEKKNEIIIEKRFSCVSIKLSEANKFFNPKIETAPRIGIDNKNEIFVESTLLNFKNLAAVIAIPDLLTPGIKERIWNKPINIADL